MGERFTGHMLGIPAVDARSVGAGGGSIAWLDDAGLLRVGPQSAGADPGPACYGQGGTSPTVTDAAVVLGYIDPEYFLGGKMSLDTNAAAAAIDSIAKPLGITIEQAAYSIFTVSNETMINAIKEITVSEGIDPSESIIVAGGGAAGLGIVPIARELGCRAVIVPRTASVLSACGMQFSDIQMEASRSIPTRSDIFDRSAVNAGLDEIDKDLQRFADKLASRGFTDSSTTHRTDAHYAAQVWDLAIDLPNKRLTSEADVDALCEAFHQSHERIFNIDDRASAIEYLNWTGRISVALPQSSSGDMTTLESKHSSTDRGAYFDLDAQQSTTVLKGHGIKPGQQIEGPAIIEEETTTVVLPPGSAGKLSANGNYIIEWTD